MNKPARVAEGAGSGEFVESPAKASRPARVESADGLRTYMTASDLETHLACAIAAHTNGRVQTLRVQVLGGRTVLHGLAESYHAVQLAVAALLKTLKALDLDHPDRIDLNIDVLPHRPARPQAASSLPRSQDH